MIFARLGSQQNFQIRGDDGRVARKFSASVNIMSLDRHFEPRELLKTKPYHIFTTSQKSIFIGVIGVAGFFSGLSSIFYFSALHRISKDLKVDTPPSHWQSLHTRCSREPRPLLGTLVRHRRQKAHLSGILPGVYFSK